MTNERTYQAIIGVLAVLVVFLGWWIISHPSAGEAEMNDDTQMSDSSSSSGIMDDNMSSGSSSPAPTMTGSGEAVSVASQAAGVNVTVSSLTLAQPGWVAVRDSSGRTLGAAWFDAGTHTGVSVPLLRSTEAGQSYQVLLYADSGNDHQFDLHSDVLITNSDGSVAGTTFSVQ